MDELTAERVARNQATFRDANERIVSSADAIGVDAQRVPVLCECSDPACTQVLLVEPGGYEAVRRHPRRFLHAPGHDTHRGAVVEEHDAYTVVEKIGRDGDVAEELA